MKYNNPVHRGFFPDPSVIRVGEDYYKVNSSFQYFPAIPISHSKDLVNWKVIGHGITNSDYLNLSQTLDSRGIWAPDISYHEGKFYIFATLRHNSENIELEPMRSQIMMIADKPEGPYSMPTVLPVDNIDPSHFIDDDGKHYMVIAPGACIVPLSSDCKQVEGEPIQVWEGAGEGRAEGPHILKKDGWYYAIVAEGGTGYGHGINIARSKKLYGPYEPCPYNPVLRQLNPDAKIQRSGHGKLVKTQNDEWWCMYLCGRPNGGNYTTLGRETALDRVKWTDDGWFIINDGTPSIESEMPNLPITKHTNNTFYDFTKGEISIDFMWVRNPDYSKYKLTVDGLILNTSKGYLYDVTAKNILVRREEEFKYLAETKLKFATKQAGEQAGIVCYYSTSTYIRFNMCSEGIEVVINRNMGEEKVACVNYKEDFAYLRVEVDGLRRKFLYSCDNNNWIEVAIINDCKFLSDEGVPNDRKRHTGTMVGIYALSGDNEKTSNIAVFNYFRYENRV